MTDAEFLIMFRATHRTGERMMANPHVPAAQREAVAKILDSMGPALDEFAKKQMNRDE